MPTFPQVGVEAIVEGFNTFDRQSRTVDERIRSMGRTAQGAERGMGGLGSAMGALGGFLGNVATIATGIVTSRVILGMANQLREVGSTALEAASTFQGLTIQFQTLIARERRSYQDAQPFIDMMGQQTDLTDYQINRFIALRGEYDMLRQRLADAAAGNTTYGASVEWMNTRLGQLQGYIENTIPGFQNLEVWQQEAALGNYEMSEALQDAIVPAEDLLNWIKRIAVTTPFSVEEVSRAQALGMAMGFTTEESKNLTIAAGNFTAGMGLSGEVMERILHNFGQMRAAGKVTGTELRDLARGALVPVNDILAQMQEDLGMTGMSFEDFKKQAATGALPVDAFFSAFETVMSEDFAGAMERMSRTFSAVKTNFGDFIKVVIGANILGPTLQIITDRLADLLDSLMSEDFLAASEELGAGLAEAFMALGDIFSVFGIKAPNALATVQAMTGFFKTLTDRLRVFKDIVSEGITLQGIWEFIFGDQPMPAFLSGAGESIARIFDSIGGFIENHGEDFQWVVDLLRFDLSQALSRLTGGVGDNFTGMLDNWSVALGENGDEIMGAIEGIARTIGNLANAFVDVLLVGSGVIKLFSDLAIVLGTAWGNIRERDWSGLFADMALQGRDVSLDWAGILESGISGLGNLFGQDMGAWNVLDPISSDFQALFDWQDAMAQAPNPAADVHAFLQDSMAQEDFTDTSIQAGTQMAAGIREGAEPEMVELKNWWATEVAELIALTNKLFDTHSPSRVFAGIGSNLMQGLKMGIADAMVAPQNAMAQAAQAMTGSAMAMAPAPAAPMASASFDNRSVTIGQFNNYDKMSLAEFDRMMRRWMGA